MADRLDMAEISLAPTKAELESVSPILHKQINMPQPNLVRHIYKVRKGKLTRIRVWQYADLGTCRTIDLFLTNNNNELIPIEITKVENIEKLIEDNSISVDDIEATQEELEEATKAVWNW